MTTVIFLTCVFCIVAIIAFFGEKGFKGKGMIAAVFLGGLFLAIASGGLALDVRDGLVGAADGAAAMVAGLFS